MRHRRHRDSETGLDSPASIEMRKPEKSSSMHGIHKPLGRFNSPDSPNAGADPSDPQTWNGCAYVRNNPLNATDPTGMYLIAPGDSWGDEPCFTYDASCGGPGPVPPPGWGGGGGGGGGRGGTSNGGSGNSSGTSQPFPPGSFPRGETLGGAILQYDAENGQIAASDPTSLGGATETYMYDGNGNRVEKTGPNGTTVYVYDASGLLKSEYSTAANNSPCSTCYLSWDHLGSVRMVTDQNANAVARHDYHC